MAACTCGRSAYWSEFPGLHGEKLQKCFGCSAVWAKNQDEASPTKAGGIWRGVPPGTPVMDEILSLPWHRITRVAAQDFHWSWSTRAQMLAAYPEWERFLGECYYLVLPVHELGEVVWFTARAMMKAPRAYLTPPGVSVQYWRSWGFIPRKKKSFLAITEGIADAAFLAQSGLDSIALCGMQYNGSLDYEIRGRDVMVALDGDGPGYASSTVIGGQMFKAGARSVRLVAYDGLDPTDWTDAQFAEATK